MTRYNSNQKGSALIFTLISTLVLTLICAGFLISTNASMKSSGNARNIRSLEQITEGVANKVMLRLQQESGKIYNVDLPVTTLGSVLEDLDKVTADLTDSGKYSISAQFYTSQVNDPPISYLKTVPGFPDSVQEIVIPRSDYFPEKYWDLNAKQRTYTFTVTVKNGDSEKTVEASATFFGIPLFQYAMLGDLIYWAPGKTYNVKGRIHANVAILAGGKGPVIFSPSSFENGKIALSSAHKIYNLFAYGDLSNGDTYYYVPWASEPDNYHVKVETSPSTYTRFFEHALGNYGTWPDACDNVQGGPQHCFKIKEEIANAMLYGNEIDATSSDFNGRIKSDTGVIRPPWYNILNECQNDGHTETCNLVNGVHKIIEPRTVSDDNNCSSHDQNCIKPFKKWYSSNLRIMDGKSVDENNVEIGSGVLSTASLKALGIIDRKEREIYVPTAGRKANVNYLNIAHLKQAAASHPELSGIMNIYIGGSQPPSGEVHFPSPDCDCERTNFDFMPACLRDDSTGSTCTVDVCTNGTDAYGNPKKIGKLCNPNETGTFETVMVTGGSELPDAVQITSPNQLWVQGDFNTVNEKPALINADTIGYLSNSWFTQSALGWDAANPTGPRTATTTTYAFASQSGWEREMPLMESWSGSLNRKMSFVSFWKAKEFAPKAGPTTITNWHKLAWTMYYSPATWNSSQYTLPAPFGTEQILLVRGLSLSYK